jgi:hypothetical protein
MCLHDDDDSEGSRSLLLSLSVLVELRKGQR